MKRTIISAFALATIFFVGCENLEDSVKQQYILDTEESKIEYKGHTNNYFHEGSFEVHSQNIEVVNGNIKSGTFTFPIASITNYDLPDDVKPVLLNHLKSEDFFNVVLHPDAKFELKRVVTLTQAVEGAVEGANYKVTGDFSMIGKTNQIEFPAKIVFDGDELNMEAKFKIDRTKWGMNYAADPELGEHYILPEVDIYLQLAANKNSSTEQ